MRFFGIAYIPKRDGRYRALGVPSFEDRLSRILQAIWEPEFCDCSFGFRPGRSAHDALARVAEVITNEGIQWVVEADIKGFFDHVSHTHLVRFLEHRIADPKLLRIVQRFLKAGIMDDGVQPHSLREDDRGVASKSEPDSGNPTVRDRREACGNVAVMRAGLNPIGKPMD